MSNDTDLMTVGNRKTSYFIWEYAKVKLIPDWLVCCYVTEQGLYKDRKADRGL